MKRSTIPLTRVWQPIALLSLPVVVVMAALVFLGALSVEAAFVATVVIVVVLAHLVRRHFDELDTLRDYAEDLAAAPETPAPQPRYAQVMPQLVTAIRRLALRNRAGGDGAGRIAEIGLEQLPDPMLLLDDDRQVTGTNAAARELLGHNAIGRDLAAVIRNPALLQAVDRVLRGDAAEAKVEFAFRVPVERIFSARVARLPGANGEAETAGVIIALYDLTALKRAEQMRSDFIANASHELRTPISVLLGCVHTLRGSARDDPVAQAEFFGLMEGQADRMSRLVSDLLALSRIELNEHNLPSDAVDIADVVLHVANTLAMAAKARGIGIETALPDDLPRVQGDREELVQVFQNLIDNAVKYAAENSVVRVRARVARDRIPPALPGATRCLVVAVEDQGEGIPAEHLPRLTERFYRVDTARSRQMGGTGLGLAIVKHVVNRHRGILTIDSTAGQGSIFAVWLPLGGAGAAALEGPEATPRLAAPAEPGPKDGTPAEGT